MEKESFVFIGSATDMNRAVNILKTMGYRVRPGKRTTPAGCVFGIYTSKAEEIIPLLQSRGLYKGEKGKYDIS